MRQTFAYINPKNVGRNLQQIRALIGPDKHIMAVVKADAYGHGMLPVTKALIDAGADALAVATCEEAFELRSNKVRLPILVLGSANESDLEDLIENDIAFTVWYSGQLEEIRRCKAVCHKRARVHLKIDTGMARLGVREDAALTGLLGVFRDAPELFFEGVFTHFATADEEEEDEYFQMQVARFEHALSIVRAMGFSPVVHAGNSAVTLHRPQYHYDMVRPGYALYGYDPGPGDVGFLQPAMRWTTQIVNLKWIGPDEGVSYGVTYRTDRDTLVATIPVGYADGYRRAIGNTGYVLVHGKRAPVIGRVCMDQTMIDVTGIANVAIRDEVVLLGAQGKERISANEMAAWQETIGYEVLCTIGKRVPRIYE
jgi:alanine racemase